MVKIESNAAYHASAPISKSRLWQMNVSPEWFNFRENNPEPQTEALAFGSAFHKLTLEPQDFNNEFFVLPAIDRRTREGKTAFAEIAITAQGKTIISQQMYDTALAMSIKVLENPIASALLKGDIEQSYYLTDELTGTEWKARPDVTRMIKDRGVIIDLKSCLHADTESFMRDCIKYGYDLQAAMYKAAVEKEKRIPHDFVFIAVEKEPPYMLNILQADEFMIKRGQELFREYIGIYAECKKTGNWYGYNGFSNAINNLSLPSWMVKDYE